MNTSPVRLDHVPDIRLIACDMDGTLLDPAHAVHDDFWPLLDYLRQRGIHFCPASGRQYANLYQVFESHAAEMIFIAENGSYVVRDGAELCSDCITAADARGLVQVARQINATGGHAGAVLCGKRSAYIEWNFPAFRAEVDKYYHRLQLVDDLTMVEDDFLKVAVYSFESSEQVSYPHFALFEASHQVVVSGAHWLDVMAPQANKGRGLKHIQDALQISPEQTMVFGDFLNDMEMMEHSIYSFAMANAHPKLRERARFLAPANTDNGVVRTICSVLGL
jgi:Cof subfamily protein (haloacid dehalogenase superfamily)